MGAYVAMARVERGRVRALAWDAPAPADAVQPPVHATAAMPAAAATIEPEDGVTLGEQWGRLRDQVSMVTFYLTDPESWR